MAHKVDAENDKTNTIDPERLKKEVARIEDALEAKLSHKMKYVESCKPVNERVANAYEMASKAAGVPMKVLKATIKQRELQRKIEDIPETFEDETRETFDMVCQALGDFGDLPLGAAAKDRAAKAEGKPSAAAVEPRKPRGRPRNAPSPDATPATPAEAATTDIENPAYKAGFDARMAGEGCAIPSTYEKADRDLWHNGWRAADKTLNEERAGDDKDLRPPHLQRSEADREQEIADARAAEENAARLRDGISPLH